MSKNKKQRRKAMLDNLAKSLNQEPTARLADESITRIRNEGFIISSNPFFGPNHVMPNGYFVFREKGIVGNSLRDYEAHFTDENGNKLITDGPAPIIYSNNKNGWSVTVHDYAPGPGPGDFTSSFTEGSNK